MENIRNPIGLVRAAMNQAAGIGHNRTAEARVEGTMPTTANGSPRFASRMDGVEAGIVAGTMKIVYAR